MLPRWMACTKPAGFGSIDAACGKLILKDNTYPPVVIDIFNTQRWQQAVAFGVNFNYSRKWESRNVRLATPGKLVKLIIKNGTGETGAEDVQQPDKIKSAVMKQAGITGLLCF